jgi:NADPH:quinone reductase-like Zn-dependent oxidoreductase
MDAPETMRSVRIAEHGGSEVMEVTEVPVPVPNAGEAQAQISAVALNTTDLWTREGAYGRPGDPQARSGWRGPVGFPRIQGADVAGRVVPIGADADEDILGRRVVVDPALCDVEGKDANPVGLMGSERDGGCAEYVTAPAERVRDMSEPPLCFPRSCKRTAGLRARHGWSPLSIG